MPVNRRYYFGRPHSSVFHLTVDGQSHKLLATLKQPEEVLTVDLDGTEVLHRDLDQTKSYIRFPLAVGAANLILHVYQPHRPVLDLRPAPGETRKNLIRR
jgi:hypothetical protein